MADSDKADIIINRQESNTPSTTQNVGATSFFKLINRLISNDIQKYRRGQILEFPFFVTDEHLKNLSEEITKALSDIPISSPIDFVASVRFQDLSSQRFHNFNDFLSNAGKRKDPESIHLSWSRFAITEDGEPITGLIEISFITEKRLNTQRANPDAISNSLIEFNVYGSDQRWVNELFEDIFPHLKTTALEGIFRPLRIFRNPFVVNNLSIVLGYIAVLLTSRIINNFQSKSSATIDIVKTVYTNIKKAPKIEQKFDHYITWLFTETTPQKSAREVIGHFLLLMLSFITTYVLTKYVLPMLTPNSSIAIGVARQRAQNYLNTFKFLIFSFIVGGILTPAVFELIKLFW